MVGGDVVTRQRAHCIGLERATRTRTPRHGTTVTPPVRAALVFQGDADGTEGQVAERDSVCPSILPKVSTSTTPAARRAWMER